MTLTSANPQQPHIQTNTQINTGMQPPPVSRDPTLAKLKAANLNKTYLLAHNLVPRRPAYSTSGVEVNLKSNQNQQQQELIFEPSNSFYMKLEQPIRTQVQGNARLSDQTRPRTGNYIKNCQSNLVRANHYSSSESIQPCQSNGNLYNGNHRQTSHRIRPIKVLQETQNEDNLLNRKSAFQPVSSILQKQKPGEATSADSPYIVQHAQMVVSPYPGTSSTTSSISSSTTGTSSSHCMSNSYSANSSLSYHSKSTDNILHGTAAKNNIVKLITSDSKQQQQKQQQTDCEATRITSFIGNSNRPNTESIRSGSVSSARSIYELRLKSLNENNMPQGFVPRSAHSYRLGSTGSAYQAPITPALKFQSVKLEKQPRRRTHLSDNDFLEAFSNKQPNVKFQQPPQTPDFADCKVLNKYLTTKSAGPRHSPTNEDGEQERMLLAAQRRLSYHNYKTAALNDSQISQHLKYPSHRRSVCVDNRVDNRVDVDDNTDGLVLDVDLEYGDDDIFADEEEEVVLQPKYINPIQQQQPDSSQPNAYNNQISPDTSSSPSACSSSSIVSTSSDGCNQLPTKANSKSNGVEFISESLSSGKSILSSVSSGSMNTSIHGKPPHVPSTPKSPKSYDSKQGNIFNFNNMPQGTLVQKNIIKEFSLESSLAPPPMPPPLPSQSTQLNKNTNNSQIDFMIPDQLQPFAHFDLQSSFFNFERAKLIKEVLNLSINMRTGASAASKQQSKKSQETAADTIPLRVTNNKAPTSNPTKYRSGIQSISSILGSLEQSSSVDSENIAGEIEWMERTGTIDRLKENGPKTRLSSSVFMHLNDDRVSFGDFNSLKKNRVLSASTSSHCLAEDCSFFRLELGGDVFKGLGLFGDFSQRRMMALNSVNILDRSVVSVFKKDIVDLMESNASDPFVTEFQDWGAYFYRFYFLDQEHATYLGNDPLIGPCAISIRREKLMVTDVNNNMASAARNFSTNTQLKKQKAGANSSGHNFSAGGGGEKAYEYAYRLVFRSSDLNCLRGTILEEHLHTKHASGSKGLPHKEILSYLFPQLDIGCLRLADPKVNEKLVKLDESSLVKTHKIGVLLCKADQSTEEQMYNNKESTPAFDEFLDLLGDRVTLKGFANYRGGLDVTNDTTSTHSVYTRFRDKEIMFHVSTMLPYSPNDRQQLTRKRHIGNDLVTIVFQEPGALPFSPKTIRSHFQHIFIIVRAIPTTSGKTKYSVAVSYSTDVPSFGPPLPKHPLFTKSHEFRQFLLAKIVNADAAGLRCEKFTHIKMRAQQGTLKELIQNYSTKVTLANMSTSISGSVAQKLGLLNFGSVKQKKTRSKSLQMFNSLLAESESFLSASLAQLTGCIFWNISLIEDFQYTLTKSCYLGVSRQQIVAVDAGKKSVLFSIACNAVIGWTFVENGNTFQLYFDQGEFISVKCRSASELQQVIRRLEYFTRGCRTLDLCLEKKDYGNLGFSIHSDGVVTDVEKFSLAYYRGLKQGTRILKINDYYVISLANEKMIDILRKSTCLRLTFLVPLEDGACRRGQEDNYSLYHYLSTCSSENERLIDQHISLSTSPQGSNYPQGMNNKKMSESALQTRQYQANRLAQSRQSIASESHVSRNAAIYDETYLANYAALTNKNLDLVKQRGSSTRKSSQSSLLSHQGSVFQGSKSRGLDLDDETSSSTIHEWNKLVQTAIQECSDDRRSRDYIVMDGASWNNKSRNYIYTKEILENNDLIGIRNNFMSHKQKRVSYEELKDHFIQMQIKLNQEKQEKENVSHAMQKILNENLKLRQENCMLKGEKKNKRFCETVCSNTSSSENCSENSMKLVNNSEFVDLNKSTSV